MASMTLLDMRPLPGPNVYTHRPAVVARLDLGPLTGRETREFPGFVDRLVRTLPGLGDHHCSLGRPGGFVERLKEGTFFGHVVEHVAIELQCLAGCNVGHGKTRATERPNVYRLAIEYCSEAAIRMLLPEAVVCVETLLRAEIYPVAEVIARAQQIMSADELGPTTRAIVDAARRQGIPAIRLDEGSLVQLGWGVHRRLVQAAETSFTSSVAVDISCDKVRTKDMLEKACIPVPRGIVVETADDAVRQLAELNPPLVIKPWNGNQGRGVALDLFSAAAIAEAFKQAAKESSRVIVEEQFTGRDYRLLIIDGKLVAASERTPAAVVGDGRHTIAELIEIENRTNPLRGHGHEKPLTRLCADAPSSQHLQKSGQSLFSVPRMGERVTLRDTANLSTGGTAADVTDQVHPEIRRMCERAARIIGLDICGIDLITPDISRPLPAAGAGIVEVNAAPGLRMHQHPNSGQPRDAGAAVVNMLFPGGSTGRVPTVAVTGTNGKTTVTRMIAAMLSTAGKTVGLTTTDGIWIDGHQVAAGDMTGFHSARVVLGDPAVEAAVLETARGGIVRRGLGYDWTDVGVITNIQPDHIGQDGIEKLEDLVHIKALVAERVRDGGTLVLNADDPNVTGMTARRLVAAENKRIIYFSLANDNPLVLRHLAQGHSAFWLEDGSLVEGTGWERKRFIGANRVPSSFRGLARFQLANALAASAAARALGVPLATIAEALGSFDSLNNPGRLNLYSVQRGYVLLDYGHNPGAFEAIGGLAAGWGDRRITAVFTVPGDRADELILESGRVVAASFHRVIIKEDRDGRGRSRGEVARLLCQAVHQIKPDMDCDIVLDEIEAIRVALRSLADGEIVIVFYDDCQTVMDVLREFGARPVAEVKAAGAAAGR